LECGICGIDFNSVKDYNSHMITMEHKKVKIFCEFCKKQLNIQYYEQHVLLKHDGGHACNICVEKFYLKEDLRKHLIYHKTNEKIPKKFKCSNCDEEFDTINEQRSHNISVHGSQTWKVCQICGKTVKSQCLWSHEKSHNENMFKCEVCGKAFNTKTRYREHERIHTGEKPYVCQVCGAKFSRSNHLARHRLVHSGEKPHVCNLCGRGFNQPGNLKTHMKSHIRGTIPMTASE